MRKCEEIKGIKERFYLGMISRRKRKEDLGSTKRGQEES